MHQIPSGRSYGDINGDIDKNGNGRIDPLTINPDGEEGTRLTDLKTNLNIAKAGVAAQILAVDNQINYLEEVSQTTSGFITALNVATQTGANWETDFTGLRDSLDTFVTPANVAMASVNSAYTAVATSLGELLSIFNLAKIDLSIDVNLDFSSLEDIMDVLEEPLRIAASAIEPIEPYLDAVGAAVDLIVTPVVKFLTETLDLNTFLDGITDQIEQFLPDFSPLEDFEAQVNALISELADFTAATMGEIDALLSNVSTAVEKVGDAASMVPVWGDIALGPVGVGNFINEILIGGSDDEIFDPKAGNDTVNAGGGNDIIMASTGNDTINGGGGVDMLYIDAAFGEFELFREVANGPIKILHVRPGQNARDFGSEIIGTDVEILAFSNVVFDNIQDAIIGGSILLGDVNDQGTPGDTSDDTNDLPADDLLILNTTGTLVNGFHQANGLDGDDSIYGTAEADHLIGGIGNDLLVGQDGDDLLDGGAGSDTFLQLEGNNERIKVELGDGVGQSDAQSSTFSDEDDDTLLNIENFISEGENSGDQRFVFGDSNNNTLKTGAGSDILVGGAGDDIIDGGDATDMLIGGDGSDRIFGRDGGDFIIGGGQAVTGKSDVYDGGEGLNTLTFESNPNDPPNQLSSPTIDTGIISQAFGTITTDAPVRIDADTGIIEHLNPSGGVITTDSSFNFNRYIGSDFNDIIFGFSNRNGNGQVGIEGGNGNDALYLRNSNYAFGGNGDDTIFITQGASDANLEGGQGNDTLDIAAIEEARVTLAPESPGSSQLTIRLYQATIEVDFLSEPVASFTTGRFFNGDVEGIENFTFGDFDDYVDLNTSLSSNSYNIDTAGGNDLILHNRGYVDLETGSGNDRVIADAAADVSAGAGDDYIEFNRDGDAGSTRSIDAGSGNDTIVLRNFGLSTVAASVTGGIGFDTLTFKDFQNGASILVDLLAGTAADQGGTGSTNAVNASIASVERVIGSVGNDMLLGSNLGDQLIGREGSDQIDGRGGNDIIYGGDSNDTLTGGDGNDFIHGGLGNDTINGGTNTDPSQIESDTVSYATGYRDSLLGELVADVFGGVSVDLATGTSSGAFGNDTLSGIENIHGSNNDDFLEGDAGANYLAGGRGSDFMSGRNGNDFFSLQGDDWAEGGAGDDTFFIADGGNYSINGGLGQDIIDFSSLNGSLVIDLSQSEISGTLDVMTPVWSDLGTSEPRHIIPGDAGSPTLTPQQVYEADPSVADELSDLKSVPDDQAFDIQLVPQSQAYQSVVTGIEEVIGTSGNDTFIGEDSGILGNGSLNTINLNPGSETNQYIEVSSFSAMPTGNLTFEMLFRSNQPLDPAGPELFFASYAVGSTNGGNSILISGPPTGTIGLRFNGNEFYSTSIPTSTLTDGTVHRLSVVYNSTLNEVGLFIDGSEVFTGTTVTLNGIPSGGTLLFGQEQDDENTTSDFNSAQILPGEIADIRIWNDARTSQEIADNAFIEIANPVSDASLVANWRPDATLGTIPDAKGGAALTLQSYDGSPLPEFSSFAIDGSETLRGGEGSDTYFIANSNTTIIELAGEGFDKVDTDLSSYTLPDNIERLAFTDTNNHVGLGNGLDNVLVGNSGRDSLAGLGGNDTISGGGDNDTLFGQNGNDILNGNIGDDRLVGGEDDDALNGGLGDDNLNGGDGDDVLDGGSNTAAGDTATYEDAGSGVRALLAVSGIQNTLGAGRDTFIGIENLIGSAFDDSLYGDGGDNVLEGGDGADRIVAGDGNDTLRGGAGNDILKGRGGDDMLFGDAGDDILFADAGVDTLDGGADNDFLYGGSSNDVLDGGTGDDRLRGNLNNDTLNGGEGIDLLFGGGQNDTLNGDTGNDNLRGENGNDILDGGSGDDVLFGNGLGNTGDADIFVFKTGNEIDRIRDWEDGTDMIDLTSYGFATAGDALAQFSQVGGSVRFMDGSDTLIIENENIVNITDLDIMV